MCRYAMKKYKAHYVCFDCRKGFKQPPIEDLIIANGDWHKYQKAYLDSSKKIKMFRLENPEIIEFFKEKYLNRVCKCPDCGREMKNVGLDFKTPRREKSDEWKILESLYAIGRFFYSCWCDAYGFIPKDKDRYEKYLLESKRNFQQRLEQRDEKRSIEELKDYLDYWSEKISLVNEELRKITQKA
jgi:hypothetical protein